MNGPGRPPEICPSTFLTGLLSPGRTTTLLGESTLEAEESGEGSYRGDVREVSLSVGTRKMGCFTMLDPFYLNEVLCFLFLTSIIYKLLT